MTKGAIILCGGKSHRMGRDKAMLPFGTESLLQRVARLTSEVVRPAHIVVVAAPGQPLPILHSDIHITWDALPNQGPLMGLVTGLRAIAKPIDAVFATGCDVPLLVPAFLQRMFELVDQFDVAVPFDGDRYHPLSAVYRPAILPVAEGLLESDRFRLQSLFDNVRTRCVNPAELTDADPQLLSLRNLNRPQDYREALAIAGFAVSSTDEGP